MWKYVKINVYPFTITTRYFFKWYFLKLGFIVMLDSDTVHSHSSIIQSKLGIPVFILVYCSELDIHNHKSWLQTNYTSDVSETLEVTTSREGGRHVCVALHLQNGRHRWRAMYNNPIRCDWQMICKPEYCKVWSLICSFLAILSLQCLFLYKIQYGEQQPHYVCTDTARFQ